MGEYRGKPINIRAIRYICAFRVEKSLLRCFLAVELFIWLFVLDAVQLRAI
jgi:hypothetical protein